MKGVTNRRDPTNLVVPLVDGAGDLDTLGPSLEGRPVTWVVLGAAAAHELDRRGIVYRSIESYCTPDEIWERVAEETPRRIEVLCRVVDEALSEEGIKGPILAYFKYHLAILFDSVVGRLFLLKAMLDELKPSEVAFIARPKSGSGILFSNADTLWGWCATLASEGRATLVIEDRSPPPRSGSPLKRAKSRLLQKARESFLADGHLTFKALGLRGALVNVARKKEIVFLGPSYEWIPTLSLLSKEGKGIDFKRSLRKKKELEAKASHLWQRVRTSLNSNNSFRGAFLAGGVNFLPLLASKLDRMMVSGLAQRLETQGKGKKRPKVVLMSNADEGAKWVYLHGLREGGTQVVVWPHGPTGFFYSEKTEAPTLHLEIDRMLVYGAGAEETMEPIAKKYGFSTTSVGSSSLDGLVASIRNQKGEFVLYALTNYFRNTWVLNWYPPWLDTALYRARKEILQYLDGLPNTNVVVKNHPSSPYQSLPIDTTSSQIQVAAAKYKFPHLIHRARAIIVETLTTTCLQAMTSKTPMFVLMTNHRLPSRAQELLEKRAICARTPEEMVKALDDYLVRGIYPADVNNDEALRAYGTHVGDGNSAERAADVVREALRPGMP